MDWKEETPESPCKDSEYSDWYWFWPKNEKQPWVVELWPGRDPKYLDGMWGDKLTPPPRTSPFKERGTDVDSIARSAKRPRGRPRKTS